MFSHLLSILFFSASVLLDGASNGSSIVFVPNKQVCVSVKIDSHVWEFICIHACSVYWQKPFDAFTHSLMSLICVCALISYTHTCIYTPIQTSIQIRWLGPITAGTLLAVASVHVSTYPTVFLYKMYIVYTTVRRMRRVCLCFRMYTRLVARLFTYICKNSTETPNQNIAWVGRSFTFMPFLRTCICKYTQSVHSISQRSTICIYVFTAGSLF